jgi:hypothetical protein
MALLYMDGFEAGDSSFRYGGTALTVFNSPGRFGTGRYATFPSGGSTKSLSAGVNRLIMGMAQYQQAGSDTINFITMQGDLGGTNHTSIRLMAAGAIGLYRGTTQIAITANGLFTFNVWHYIEFSATVSDTVGVAKVRLDGTEVISFTGDTKNAGTNLTIDTVQIIGVGASSRTDDLYICDDTGSAPNNDFLGDSRVITLVPTGPGANTSLTPSAGANWTCVDELPYSATDFVTSATVGARDTYAMSDLPAGVTTIFGVQQNAIAKKSDAGTRSIKNVLRSGGTDYPDAAAQPLAVGDSSYRTLRQTDPATSAAWTIAGVNAIEAGVEVA